MPETIPEYTKQTTSNNHFRLSTYKCCCIFCNSKISNKLQQSFNYRIRYKCCCIFCNSKISNKLQQSFNYTILVSTYLILWIHSNFMNFMEDIVILFMTGVKNMAKAYVSQPGHHQKESLVNVKCGYKECTQVRESPFNTVRGIFFFFLLFFFFTLKGIFSSHPVWAGLNFF